MCGQIWEIVEVEDRSSLIKMQENVGLTTRPSGIDLARVEYLGSLRHCFWWDLLPGLEFPGARKAAWRGGTSSRKEAFRVPEQYSQRRTF